MTYDLEKLDMLGTWVYRPGEGFVPLCGSVMLSSEAQDPSSWEPTEAYGREDFERWVYSLRADA